MPFFGNFLNFFFTKVGFHVNITLEKEREIAKNMREPYISRHYLKEKYDHIKWYFEDVLEVGNTELDDGIPYEKVQSCVLGIFDAWESIAKEISKKPYIDPEDIEKDPDGSYKTAIDETSAAVKSAVNALHQFVEDAKKGSDTENI